MATIIYQPQDNGNLKWLHQSELDNAALAVDEFLDESPRSQVREFACIVTEDGEFGQFVTVAVEDDEPVQPRRKMRVAGANAAQATSNAGKRRGGRRAKAVVEDEPAVEPEVEPAPARRKPGPKPGSKRKAGAKKPGPKPAAKLGKSNGKASGSKKNPLKKNAATAE